MAPACCDPRKKRFRKDESLLLPVGDTALQEEALSRSRLEEELPGSAANQVQRSDPGLHCGQRYCAIPVQPAHSTSRYRALLLGQKTDRNPFSCNLCWGG